MNQVYCIFNKLGYLWSTIGPMKLKTLLLTALLSISLTSITNANFPRCHISTVSDSDWNIRACNNAGFPVPFGENRNMRWLTEGGNKFLRVQLRAGDINTSNRDKYAEYSYDFKERAELKSTYKFERNSKYEFQLDMRIVQGMGNWKETFFQIHTHTPNCQEGPSIMVKIGTRWLLVDTRRALPSKDRHMDHHKIRSVSIEDLGNEWNTFKVILDTHSDSHMDLYLNEQHLITSDYEIPKCAPRLNLIFGLYRPGYDLNENTTSIIDFDKILVKKLK